MREIDLQRTSLVVTGGTGGIGSALLDVALDAGASVTFCARTNSAVERALAARKGRRIIGLDADISKPADVRRLFDVASSTFGEPGALIHAAAVIGPIGRAGDLDPNAWLEALNINLFGSYLLTAEACRRMEARGGRIVLFSGGGGTGPFPRYSAYAAAKAAVVRLVETVALEYADAGIEINAVAPGFVASRMHEATLAAGENAGADYLERTRREIAGGGVPPEVGARCACFLASADAHGISGRIIAAPWDDWENLPARKDRISGSDLFTIRRIVPRDRGENWQ